MQVVQQVPYPALTNYRAIIAGAHMSVSIPNSGKNSERIHAIGVRVVSHLLHDLRRAMVLVSSRRIDNKKCLEFARATLVISEMHDALQSQMFVRRSLGCVALHSLKQLLGWKVHVLANTER